MRRAGRGVAGWIALVILGAPAASAGDGSTVSISVGSLLTDLEVGAVRLAAEYSEDLPDIFLPRYDAVRQRGSLWDLSPSLTILTGDHDSFNGVVARLAGNYMQFGVVYVDEAGRVVHPSTPDAIRTPATAPNQTLHIVQVALATETDRGFHTISTLVEVGYTPRLIADRQPGRWLELVSAAGIFLQGGGKFAVHEANLVLPGGGADQSLETTDSGLLRVRGELEAVRDLWRASTAGGDRGFRLLANGTGWWDVANAEPYHRLELIAEFYGIGGRAFDFRYENGSGAPHFNQGDQFSANITVRF